MILTGLVLTLTICHCFGHVLELDDSFLELEKEGMWLVMFYAPWCGHCRSMEPTWLEVGATFKDKQSDVKVAKVDATLHSSVGSHYDIRGFPTIKFFKDGIQYDYSGARNKYSIIGFVNRAKGPSITVMSTQDEFIAARKEHNVVFVYVGENEEPLYNMFLPITKELFTKINFFTATKKLLPKDVTVKRDPTLLVFKDNSYYELPADLPDDEFLKLWVETEQFTAYNQLTGMSYHMLRAAGRRFAIVVLKPKDSFNETFHKMALERKHPYMFCWVSGNAIANSMTNSNVSVPNVLVYDTQSHEYFVMVEDDESRELTKENVEEFFQNITDGKIEPKGGNGFFEDIQKLVVEFVRYIVNLFKTSPIVASLIVILPSILVSTLCVCFCQMRDEDVVYKMGSHADIGERPKIVELDREDSDKKKTSEKAPTQENEPVGDAKEGLRMRAKDNANKH